MSASVAKMNKEISSLNQEKNQLLSEKEESDKNFQKLSDQHAQLKTDLERINKEVAG